MPMAESGLRYGRQPVAGWYFSWDKFAQSLPARSLKWVAPMNTIFDGSMARWLDGSMARWRDGSMARWLDALEASMTGTIANDAEALNALRREKPVSQPFATRCSTIAVDGRQPSEGGPYIPNLSAHASNCAGCRRHARSAGRTSR